MIHIMTKAPEDLRAQHVADTRRRILDGLVKAMADGIGDLSIPAVARHAGVSVPTVYRHFRTKKALVAALAEHVGQTARLDPGPMDSLDELTASVRVLFKRLDDMDETLRAAMASQMGKRMRRTELIARRTAVVRTALADSCKRLAAPDRDRLCNVVVVLWSSAALSAFKDYVGLSAEEAADHVAWAIRALVEGANTKRGKR